MQYRADIEGLRAISVILVFLYHLGLADVPGGFIGVDVFFVTSGYLISGILLRALEARTFSLLAFYERRVRRIVPALLLIVAATLPAGYFLLFPGDYKVLADSSLHAMLAVSNFFFYWNTGYFDGPAELAPLLHTWSLGVEEQFYFVWPLFLAIAYRLCRGRLDRMAIVIAIIIATSFGWNLWETASNPKAAFYLPLARIWELALGTLLVLLPPLPPRPTWRKIIAELLALAGIAAIVCGALVLSAKQPYPGAAALMPVLGAAALLYRTGEQTAVARLFSTPPMVLVGKLSYSLYLWHWPVIVFARHYTNAAPFTPIEMLVIAAVSFAGAFISWQFVEKPFRFSGLSQPAIFVSAAAAAAVVALGAWSILDRDGLPQRIPAENRALADKAVMWEWACPQEADFTFPNFYDTSQPLKPCVLGADWHTAKVRGFIWGDSNSQHIYHLLHPVAQREGIAIATIFPCPAVIDVDHLRYDAPAMPIYNQSCTTIRQRLLEYLRKSPDIGLIILAASWTTLPWNVSTPANEKRSSAGGIKLIGEALDRLLPQLAQPGRRVVLFADFPNIVPSYAVGRAEKLTDPVACVLATSKLLRRPCDLDQEAWSNFEVYGLPVHNALRQALARHPGIVGHFPEDYLCEPGKCRTWLGDEFLYRDSNHIRRNLRPDTVEAFGKFLKLKQMLTGID